MGSGVDGLGKGMRALHNKVESGNRGLRLLCWALFHGAYPSPEDLEELSRDLGLPPPGHANWLRGARPTAGLKAVPILAQNSLGLFPMRSIPSYLRTRLTPEEGDRIEGDLGP